MPSYLPYTLILCCILHVKNETRRHDWTLIQFKSAMSVREASVKSKKMALAAWIRSKHRSKVKHLLAPLSPQLSDGAMATVYDVCPPFHWAHASRGLTSVITCIGGPATWGPPLAAAVTAVISQSQGCASLSMYLNKDRRPIQSHPPPHRVSIKSIATYLLILVLRGPPV